MSAIIRTDRPSRPGMPLPIDERVTESLLNLSGTYSYRSSAQFQPVQNPETIQGSCGPLNLSVGVREKSGKYSISVFCNDVIDRHYLIDMEDFWSGPWSSNNVVAQPARDSNRYFGVRLQAGF